MKEIIAKSACIPWLISGIASARYIPTQYLMCLNELNSELATSLQVCLRKSASALDRMQTKFNPPSWFLISSNANFSNLPVQMKDLVRASNLSANLIGRGKTWHRYHNLLVPNIWSTSILCLKVSKDLRFQENKVFLNFWIKLDQFSWRICL